MHHLGHLPCGSVNAAVSLFFEQTLIQLLRDAGCNHTTSALCERVDNATHAGATEIRVFFHQAGKRGNCQIDAAVYNNGSGMAPAATERPWPTTWTISGTGSICRNDSLRKGQPINFERLKAIVRTRPS